MILPKVGDKVIVWKDGSLWVGTITKHIGSGRTWHSGHHLEMWEMKIEDCDKGKSYSYWIGKSMTFTMEEVTGMKFFCLYTDEKYEKVKAAVKAIFEARHTLWNLLEYDEEVKQI